MLARESSHSDPLSEEFTIRMGATSLANPGDKTYNELVSVLMRYLTLLLGIQ